MIKREQLFSFLDRLAFYFFSFCFLLLLVLAVHSHASLIRYIDNGLFNLLRGQKSFLSFNIRLTVLVFDFFVILSRVYLKNHFSADILASLSLDILAYYL